MKRVAPASSKASFIRRMCRLRKLGFLLAGIAIAAQLRAEGAALWLWAVLFLSCVAWPLVALARAHTASNPVKAEFSNVLFDSVLGGFWIAAMQFSVLPSALIVAMLGISHVAMRGLRFLAQGIGVAAASASAAAVALGAVPRLEIDLLTLSLLPFLLVYPIAISIAMRQLTVRMQHQRKLLDRLVSTDGLTGLANRQHWEWCAENHLADTANTPDGSAALMMIDIDRFKAINDRYGHLFGDEVITTVAHTLRDAMRAHDAVGRYAGDEFAVALAGVDAPTAQAIAERFRRAVAKLRFPGAPLLDCSVSVGVAMLEPGWDLKEWIRSADHALYESKRAGRNCVSLYGRDPREPDTLRSASDMALAPTSNVLALRSARAAGPVRR